MDIIERLIVERDMGCATRSAREVMADAANEITQLRKDARRYRRLQILGCAVGETPQLAAGTVVRFTGLDEIVDHDLKHYPSRGEAAPLPQ